MRLHARQEQGEDSMLHASTADSAGWSAALLHGCSWSDRRTGPLLAHCIRVYFSCLRCCCRAFTDCAGQPSPSSVVRAACFAVGLRSVGLAGSGSVCCSCVRGHASLQEAQYSAVDGCSSGGAKRARLRDAADGGQSHCQGFGGGRMHRWQSRTVSPRSIGYGRSRLTEHCGAEEVVTVRLRLTRTGHHAT